MTKPSTIRINVSMTRDVIADLGLLSNRLAIPSRSKLIAIAVKLLVEDVEKRQNALEAEVQYMIREELLNKLS